MDHIVDKCFLFGIGLWVILGDGTWIRPVGIALTALIYTALTEYAQAQIPRMIGMIGMMGICLWFPEGVSFFPLIVYEIMVMAYKMCLNKLIWGVAQRHAHGESDDRHIRRGWGIVFGMGILCVGFFLQAVIRLDWDSRQIILVILLMGLGVLLALRTSINLEGKEKLIHLRDDSTELTNMLKVRQQELIVRQDYEIHLATLKERNRIAREIHDNVGHMLTRSILQVGALEVIHRDEVICGQLHEVGETLNEAMNNIRQSVRDLHDESLDLEQAVKDAAKELDKNYTVHLEYDLPENVPRNVKYCLLAITKEALSNVNRHSNGDQINLIFREHPAFWQLAIDDNGTNIQWHDHPGIGLVNMEERTEALGGQVHFSVEHGFGIMVTIPR